MLRHAVLLVLALSLSACDVGNGSPRDGGEVAVARVGLSTGGARDAAPVVAARGFLDAVASGDEAKRNGLLTVKARESHETGGFSFASESLDGYRLGEPSVNGTEARVPVSVETDGRAEEMHLLLRREAGEWRVRGAAVSMGESELTIDFERMDDTFSQLGDELAASLAEGMTQAFDEAVADWQAGGSAEEIAAARASFDALRSLDSDAFDDAWRFGLRADAPARELVARIVGEVVVDEGALAERFAREVRLDVDGVSRLEALERVCDAIDVVPVLPEPTFGFGAEPEPITFRAGEREQPLAFAGPFAVEVVEVGENPPHTTGSLRLRAAALGLGDAMLAANGSMAEFLRVELVGSGGQELLADPGMQYMGQPTIEGGLFQYAVELDLVGLLRAVETIERVRGRVFVRLPVSVHVASFDSLEAGARSDGAWSIVCDQAGEAPAFTLASANRSEDREVSVRFRADAAGERPLGILWESVSGWGEELRADVQLPEVPARLELKVFETEEVAYAFELEGVRLRHAGEQPERLEPLRFRGDAPLSVAYLGGLDVAPAAGGFHEVRIEVSSLANKDALDAQADFVYLDGAGRELESFPHTISGTMTFEGTEPVAPAGSTSEQQATAFFVPEGARTVRIDVAEVSFVDGTAWRRD